MRVAEHIALPPSSTQTTCGDGLDFAPGDTFSVQAEEETSYGGGGRDRWGKVSVVPKVVFGNRLDGVDAPGGLTFRLDYAVTIGTACSGKWQARISADRGREFDRFVSGNPPSVTLTREFLATSSFSACNLTVQHCLDEYAVELTPQ